MFKIGYYTHYWLQVKNAIRLDKKKMAAIRLADIIGDYDENDKKHIAESHYPFDFLSYDTMKWYDWERDMRTLAKEFPEMEFILYGEGEERDDNWRAFFKGDKYVFQQEHCYYDPEPNFEEEE